MDLARPLTVPAREDVPPGLERTARLVRAATVVVAVAVGSSMLALHEFDRAWGSGPLGTGTSVDAIVVELGGPADRAP